MKYEIGDENCTGCMACYNKCPVDAIILQANEEGFIYPIIDTTKCTGCNICKETCPLNKDNEESEKIVFSFQCKDKFTLQQSSSGGFFSIAASQILNKNGIIYGAAFDEKFNLRHIRVDNITDLEKLRGSKYLQSEIGTVFKEVETDLKSNKKVLFTGTSCQIAGLKSYLGKEYQSLLTIDLVCHGVPSPLIFKSYLKYLEEKLNDKITYYSFRNKKYSWHVYNTLAHCGNTNTPSKIYIGKWEKDPYMRGFLREYFLRKSCHNCKWANINKPADITIADFWGYKSRKELPDKDEGISMVMLHTSNGADFFEAIPKSQYTCVEVPLNEAINGNKALNNSFAPNPLRTDFWIDYRKHGFSEYLIKKYLYKERLPLIQRPIYMLRGNSIFFKLYKKMYWVCTKNFGKIIGIFKGKK